MQPLRIGILGFDGLTALDLVGPADAFSAARISEGTADAAPCYEIVTIGLTRKPFTAECGLRFLPDVTLRTTLRFDTLIVPGGPGLRTPEMGGVVAPWIAERAGRTRRIVTVCTGIYGVAPTGLLDGRQVTTHWAHARDLARRYPKLRVQPDALYLQDGPFHTSAGITAGIDLSLALIEKDFGPRAALAVARELVVFMRRPGGQEQYSEPLRFQARFADRFAELAGWIVGHLQHNLSVTELAGRVALSPRQFSRRLRADLGTSPAAWVEELRLGEARRRLSGQGSSVERVALSVGYRSDDAFRRAFERRYGVAPTQYRKQFASTSRGVAA